MARYLPDRRKQKKPRYARRPRGLVFPPDRSIHEQPDCVKDRATFGEWDGDLMVFRREHGKANVASLVERKTLNAFLLRNNDRSSTHRMNRLMSILEPLPRPTRGSITFARGIEFSSWRRLETEIGTTSWFCDPQAPLSAVCCAGAYRAKRGRKDRSKT
nr:IS30 family transposase [Ruegeria arenilitoris]